MPVCVRCGSTSTITRRRHEVWYDKPEGIICFRCFIKQVNTGHKHVQWVKHNCENCGKAIFRKPSHVRNKHFCNIKCKAEWQRGKDHSHTLGRKRSPETSIRLSIAKKGVKLGDRSAMRRPEVAAKVSKALKGRTRSVEHSLHISEAKKGIPNLKLSKKISVSCTSCGKLLFRKLSRVKRYPHQFCNSKCRDIWLPTFFYSLDYDQNPSSIELLLQEELLLNGVYFDIHKAVYGKPDIYIDVLNSDGSIVKRICIMVDGTYFHRDPRVYEPEHKSRGLLAKNIWRKDEEITKRMRAKGFIVFRFWEKEIREDPSACIDQVMPSIIDESKLIQICPKPMVLEMLA